MAKLPHILDNEIHSVGITFAQQAAAGVVWPSSAEPDRPV
jgi:hypothetical protein